MINKILLFGAPNGPEVIITAIFLFGIPYGIFRIGVWYGATKEIERRNNELEKKRAEDSGKSN